MKNGSLSFCKRFSRYALPGLLVLICLMGPINCGDGERESTGTDPNDTRDTQEQAPDRSDIGGAATPEELYKAYTRAWKNQNWSAVYQLYAPSDRLLLLGNHLRDFHLYTRLSDGRSDRDLRQKFDGLLQKYGLQDRVEALRNLEIARDTTKDEKRRQYRSIFREVNENELYTDLASLFYERPLGNGNLVIYDRVRKHLKRLNRGDASAIKKHATTENGRWYVTVSGFRDFRLTGNGNNESGESGNDENLDPVTRFTIQGNTFDARSKLAKTGTFFDQNGLHVILIDADISCEDTGVLVGEGNYVKIFFPEKEEAGSGYGPPTNVSYRVGDTSGNVNNPGEFSGGLTRVDEENRIVEGWIRCARENGKRAMTITGSFEATYCVEQGK